MSDKRAAHETAVKIDQDANIYVTEVDPATSVRFELSAGRQGYLLCMEGSATVASNEVEVALDRHDASEVFGPSVLTITTSSDSPTHFLLVEMEFSGVGRTDI